MRAWQDTAATLWREASYREERYAAVDLTGVRRYQEYQTPAAVPMYEEMMSKREALKNIA